MKRTQSDRNPEKKPFDSVEADYQITIHSGEQAIQIPVILKIRGENGFATIPLRKTTNDEQPFQPNASHQFTARANDVGRIQRITIEHQGTDYELLWHLKTVEIRKGNETYNFNADVRLDYKENRVNLYPIGAFLGHQKEDYVQSELRRLKENLRSESAKLRPPLHKAHQPFVFNDLRPYFDTSPVERAIYSPLDAPPGYYTRLTALRVVEPWEAYGMDYGVNYELLKQRKARSFSSKRPVSKSTDSSIDRKQGSTHLPKFPCVNMHKPAEYSRPLNMSDVPKIRSFIRTRYTAQAHSQIEKDYQRTHNDIYRMELDNLSAYHESNRENMLQVYHSYLQNTPGSKKALQEFCDHLPTNKNNNTKSSVDTTA